MSLSQSTLYTSFLKRSAPETHDADDGTSNVVHSKKKKSEDNKKKYETKRIRKFQPAWQKEFDWVVYQEETKPAISNWFLSSKRKRHFVSASCSGHSSIAKDVTKTGNGERGAGNGERKSGNELSAETSIKIQYGR